jgi:FtsP/CotA-like multicopper oxidase with cupredoxin domain
MTGDVLSSCKSSKGNSCKCEEFKIYGIYDADVQQIFPYYATEDPNEQLPIACMKRNAELIINHNSKYVGLYDGYLNDNIKTFSVKLNSTEVWRYLNGDNADAHALHFHLTSGFAQPLSPQSSAGLMSPEREYAALTYSRDVYQVGPGEIIAFNVRWANYSSLDKTSSPDLNNIGGLIHCHLLKHVDVNSMVIQYFVDM